MTSKPTIVRTVAELRKEIASFRRSRPIEAAAVGFVPTMGYLHEGHASLLRRSVQDNGLTVLSIFVNPIQFGPNEDLDKYPRDEEKDVALAASCGVDLVFLPTVQEMYPQRRVTTVTVAEVTDGLCGASRPGHFDGVATVVAKLLNIVQPDRAYFGLKDAQQVAVVTRMAQDLNIPTEIVPCPTVREEDGLALSSRNVYLNAEEREQALSLSRSLSRVAEWIGEGVDAPELSELLKREIRRSPLAKVEYAEALTYPDLLPPEPGTPLRSIDGSVLVALAVRFGTTRLIDNRLLNPKEVGVHACFAK
ncbi:pantoate--beta-alanine ligase [Cohnella sp. CIP 111063]|uniref:pantoate--beta-alanine ligase n=1 Tax=unclassified Cohnella TaxID=2636738 RepID=UPI000B8C538F|nr:MULTISPECIES: pantoate--beta-alanine ligase [unclassified Cohnella]OXS61160.1 pantoate--beta-alanine ligase [Cohnella sp. CIP 111063]PRX73717.1 pantoate--beta-alanine ligase [Cohnella sp. SGD-V74]